MWDASQRELENLWNQVEKDKKKKSRKWESWRKKERGRFWNQVESKGKKKGEDGILWVYVCGVQNARAKKKEKKGNIQMKERQRIRYHNLKILPQYFYNKF